MDNNARRWMLFMLVALLVFQFGYLLPAEKKRKQELERQQAAEKVLSGPQTGLADDSDSTATVTQAMEVEEPVQEVPAEKITVETKAYRITFTTAGGNPVSWQVIDPRFAKVTQADVDEAEVLGHAKLEIGKPLPIELIPDYPGLDSHREYPLQVVLKESGGEFFRSFNQKVYEVSKRQDSDGAQIVRFVSPVSREGLQLVKTYRIPSNGYLTTLRIELMNTPSGSQRFSFSEPNFPGLGLLWGPGIATPFISDRRAIFDVAAYRNGEVLSVKPKWEKAATGEVVEEDILGDLKWRLIESRFYMASNIPVASHKASLVKTSVKA